MRSVKNRPILYGLTGSIGSGKSTASNYFKERGFKVFDADLAVKEIWKNNSDLIAKIKKNYKIDIKTEAGKNALAKIIYSNKEEREKINKLIHPLVFEMLDKFIFENNNEKALIIDMPLLFEVNYDKKVDYVILIDVDFNTQIKRLSKRDNISVLEAKKRIASQMSLADKIKLSDYVIDNNKDLENTYLQLERIYEVIKDED